MGKGKFRGAAFDHGGDGHNGGQKLVPRRACTSMRCESCDTLEFVTPGQIARAKMHRCSKCGGYMVDTVATDLKKGSPVQVHTLLKSVRRMCRKCGMPLSRYNDSDTCEVCFKAERKASGIVTGGDDEIKRLAKHIVATGQWKGCP